MREDHNRPTPRMTRHVWPAALAGVLLLSACQTSRIGGGEKEQIKNSLRGFQNAINARSFDQLDPVLSAEVQVDGLPGGRGPLARWTGATCGGQVADNGKTLQKIQELKTSWKTGT